MSAPRRCRLGVTIKPPREKTHSDLDALAGMASTVFARCFQTIQGQCLFDLAAFKITNWSKRASNHIVWAPSISFNLSLTLLDESGPYSSFEDSLY